MKRLTNYLRLSALALGLVFAFTACEDDPAPKAPLAFFTYEADAGNSQLINFTNETENGDSYVWDFGDGSATSAEVSPSHEYADGGTFTVKLTATNAGGDNVYSEDITVQSATAENLIVNGTLDDDTNWSVQQFNDKNNGSVTFENGVVVFNEIVDIELGNWDGNWAHAGIVQEIQLAAGTYIFDMDFITEGIDQTWCEVWIGATAPLPDAEYNGDNGAVRIGLINAWDCPNTATFTGSLSTGPECNPTTFELTEATTYYLVVRSGGFEFGPNGITIDNLALYKQ